MAVDTKTHAVSPLFIGKLHHPFINMNAIDLQFFVSARGLGYADPGARFAKILPVSGYLK